MINRSGSRASLFLMEQIIVILVFAICSTVCVKIFVGSYTMSSSSNDLNNAVTIAESGAECFKSVGGDIEKAVQVLSGGSTGTGSAVFYDNGWIVCAESEAAYVLRLTPQSQEDDRLYPILCDISVEKIDGSKIFSLTAAAGRSSYE